MNKSLLSRLVAASCLSLLAFDPAASASKCAMPVSFDDPYPVLHDNSKSLFWVRPMHVDADGSPNAYHRDDPHGSKGLAIEYMGNGMTIERNGEEVEFIPNEAENGEWLSIYRRIVENGWQAPEGYAVDIYGVARDENGNVCVAPDGRLTSATSLSRQSVPDFCSQKRYFDALTFPGIVVPNRSPDEEPAAEGDPEVALPFAQRGVRRGDLVITYNPATGIWKGAFLYDTGPREKLGEGSIRLVMNLTVRKDPPRSGDETNSMTIPEVYYLLFPGSVGDLGPEKEWTPRRIERAAAERFKKWGGGSITAALKRLVACAEEYERR